MRTPRRLTRKGIEHGQTLGFKHRSAFKLLTALNVKTIKGEKADYLSAILYLMPHASGGGVTLCPHSTPACREMCLAGAGMSGLPLQLAAKQRRTDLFHRDRVTFLDLICGDVETLVAIAEHEGVKPAVRLNGSSDIIWERVAPDLFDAFPHVAWYDYAKIPFEHRAPKLGYHLTYSVEGPKDMVRAVEYLRHGQSVAVVVEKHQVEQMAGQELYLDGVTATFVNGDESDLRFLDPPSSIVLLKPKGRVRTTSTSGRRSPAKAPLAASKRIAA